MPGPPPRPSSGKRPGPDGRAQAPRLQTPLQPRTRRRAQCSRHPPPGRRTLVRSPHPGPSAPHPAHLPSQRRKPRYLRPSQRQAAPAASGATEGNAVHAEGVRARTLGHLPASLRCAPPLGGSLTRRLRPVSPVGPRKSPPGSPPTSEPRPGSPLGPVQAPPLILLPQPGPGPTSEPIQAPPLSPALQFRP